MNTKDALLATALTQFAQAGYENVGIQKIIEAVDVKKPTLYYYFGSKQGLLQAVLEQAFGPFLNELQRAAHYRGDLTLTLEDIVKRYFAFARQSGEVYRFGLSLIFAAEASEARQTMQPFLDQQYTLLEAVFAQAEKDHGNMRGRSQRYALTLLGMINAYITSSFSGAIALSDESAYLACKQFMHGIFS
ncbi:MAG: TetR/AcrR family transcriptional regulator [Candidatus Sericytochromatia bacterium]